VYTLDSSTNDNGAAIDFYVKTRSYGSELPERKKKWKYLYVVADEASDHNLTVETSPDGFTLETLGTINLLPRGTTFPIILDTDMLGAGDIVRDRLPFSKNNSYYNQLKFSNGNADEQVSIRHWELLYYPRGLRDA
jgi:hypothetical protein